MSELKSPGAAETEKNDHNEKERIVIDTAVLQQESVEDSTTETQRQDELLASTEPINEVEIVDGGVEPVDIVESVNGNTVAYDEISVEMEPKNKQEAGEDTSTLKRHSLKFQIIYVHHTRRICNLS